MSKIRGIPGHFFLHVVALLLLHFSIMFISRGIPRIFFLLAAAAFAAAVASFFSKMPFSRGIPGNFFLHVALPHP